MAPKERRGSLLSRIGVFAAMSALTACTAAGPPGGPEATVVGPESTVEVEVQAEAEPDPDERDPSGLSGVWIFDQPAHAMYEASLFDLRPDGTITTLGVFEFPVDQVSRGSVTCRFGQRWWGTASGQLRLSGDCDDDRARTIELTLVGQMPGRLEIVDISVDGESGWAHHGYLWSAFRCPDPDGQCRELVEQVIGTTVEALRPDPTCTADRAEVVCMVERGTFREAQWAHLWVFGEPWLVLGPGTAKAQVSVLPLRPTDQSCFWSDRTYAPSCELGELARSLLLYDPDFSPLARLPEAETDAR